MRTYAHTCPEHTRPHRYTLYTRYTLHRRAHADINHCVFIHTFTHVRTREQPGSPVVWCWCCVLCVCERVGTYIGWVAAGQLGRRNRREWRFGCDFGPVPRVHRTYRTRSSSGVSPRARSRRSENTHGVWAQCACLPNSGHKTRLVFDLMRQNIITICAACALTAHVS